jgi:hypothetical protein
MDQGGAKLADVEALASLFVRRGLFTGMIESLEQFLN